MSAAKSVQVRIEGKVQQVWFRAWTTEQATKLGLKGWVRNRPDGTVEALFSGPDEAVDRMVEACWQGSPKSKVSAVVARPAEPPQESGFKQLPTG
jgi:acylphosphatase